MFYDIGIPKEKTPQYLVGKETGDLVTFMVHKLKHGYGLTVAQPPQVGEASEGGAIAEALAALYGAREVCGNIGNIQHAIDLLKATRPTAPTSQEEALDIEIIDGLVEVGTEEGAVVDAWERIKKRIEATRPTPEAKEGTIYVEGNGQKLHGKSTERVIRNMDADRHCTGTAPKGYVDKYAKHRCPKCGSTYKRFCDYAQDWVCRDCDGTAPKGE